MCSMEYETFNLEPNDIIWSTEDMPSTEDVPICWYCYWGWAKQVIDIYEEGLKKSSDTAMNYGPAHIVWADENFETECIQSCIDGAEQWMKDWNQRRLPWEDKDPEPKLSPFDLRVVLESLHRLLHVPEEIRCCEPENYDGEHPENFPPPPSIEMVRKY